MPLPQRILAAVDLSTQSQAIVDHACELAEVLAAKLHILHVDRHRSSATVNGATTRRGLERLAELVSPTNELQVDTVKEVISGVPHQAIVDYAVGHHIDLIVIGTHGRQGLSHLALGSVAERVLRHAPCPVQVVKGHVHRSEEPIDFVEVESDSELVQAETPAMELVRRARRLRATDIHIDPTSADESRVRMRIDGKLEEYCRLESSVSEHLVNQWKLLAGLDTADPFRPKEGRVDFPAGATGLSDVEARLTTAPVFGGEAVALRLFTRSDLYYPLSQLGFSQSGRTSIDEMLTQSEGLVLISGPTGSGKTTTVYSMLETISTTGRNIVSIEDPVEFPVPFIRQMSVDLRHGLDMTEGLRTLLRMDPDVIFVGEIRDSSAADIAMRAAGSGRYVFSTLHTRDVASVFTALRDLGLSDRSVAANISGIINQRLMRRLCTDCRRETDTTTELRSICETYNLISSESEFEKVGCSRCRGTGYSGQIGVFEVTSMTDDLKAAITEGYSEAELRSWLIDQGMILLETDALEKVVDGITDLDEWKDVHCI